MDTQEMAVAWADLTYRVKPFFWSSQKTILNNLYGSVEFGTITALMGPSGAGKTTLLNCINGKISEGLDPKTKIYVNTNQKIRSCFVAQHEKEHLIMCLTTKENLMFASKLKNSDLKSSDGPIDHKSNVNKIMDELMISDISDTRVDCCSGGQQKRLTIALEMVKVVKPNLLCIDEPTTGLDSNVAEIVMQCLQNLAKKHRIAVITSIHQPNQEIVLMFDQIYVLAKGGNCIFCGPPNTIPEYLNNNEIPFKENEVPIEQLLKLGSVEEEEQDLDLLIENTSETLRLSVLKVTQNNTKLSTDGLRIRSKSFKLIDIWYIMLRAMTQLYVRQWKLLLFQFVFYIGYAIISSKMFKEDIGKPSGCFNPNRLGIDTCLKELEDDTLLFQNQNFLFFISMMILFTNLCTSSLVYTSEAKIFYYEHQNSWYSTGSFFLAKSIVETIPTIIYGSSYAFVLYYVSGQLLERERLLGYVSIITFGFLIAESIGHCAGIILQHFPQLAILAAIGIISTMVAFANFFMPITDLPVPFQYFSDFCFPKYIFNSALLLVYGLNRCSDEEKSIVLLKYNLNGDELEIYIYKLVAYVVCTRLLSFLVLYLKTETRINLKILMNKRHSKCEEPIELKNNNKNNNKVFFNRKMSIAVTKIYSKRSSDETQDFDSEEDINNEKKLSIAWTDLTLCIPKTLFTQQKVILKQINGFFEFGTINALMGPSGAGKTSLLNCINGLYNEYLTSETTIFLSKFRKIKTCFITQNQKDHILIGLTAKQSITYASKLKNSEKNFDHKKNVENIMNELLLSNTWDTNVENCSGGEQKRLVIAMELTSGLKPNLLCIDEPTSGLDSNAAEVVIKTLKRLSINHNICVITSIHQPNNDLLHLFNKLYVLCKGGHCIYSGRPQQLSQHLADCGIECTKSQLPIEVLLKYSCKQLIDKKVEQMVERTKIFERAVIESRSSNEIMVYPDGIEMVSKRFYLWDLVLLLKRGLTYSFRFYWKIILFQFFIYLMFALLLRVLYNPNIGIPSGCVSFDDDFNNTCAKTEKKLIEEERLATNLKFNFYSMICVVFFTITGTILSFALDIKIFYNEHRNGWYSTGVFYWSKSIVEFFPIIVTIICFSYVVDIYDPENSMFVNYVYILTLGALQVQSLGHVLGTLTAENTRIGVFTVIGVFIFSFMFSNVLIPVKELHYSLQILSNFASLKLLIESVMIAFYGLDRCSDREFSYILFILDIEDRDLYLNVYLLVFEFFLFRAIAVIILLLKVNPIVNSNKGKEKRDRITQEFKKYDKESKIQVIV